MTIVCRRGRADSALRSQAHPRPQTEIDQWRRTTADASEPRSASEELKVSLDEAVVEDAAVISQFVANGNGNGNGAHDFETISGSAEVFEEERQSKS